MIWIDVPFLTYFTSKRTRVCRGVTVGSKVDGRDLSLARRLFVGPNRFHLSLYDTRLFSS